MGLPRARRLRAHDALPANVTFITSKEFACAARFTPSELSFFEQQVCSAAAAFVGNRFSTWSSEVFNTRATLKRASAVPFGLSQPCDVALGRRAAPRAWYAINA